MTEDAPEIALCDDNILNSATLLRTFLTPYRP